MWKRITKDNEAFMITKTRKGMSLRRKQKKLKHIYKERGKYMDGSVAKRYCRERNVEEMSNGDYENNLPRAGYVKHYIDSNQSESEGEMGEGIKMEDTRENMDFDNLSRSVTSEAGEDESPLDLIDFIKEEPLEDEENFDDLIMNSDLNGEELDPKTPEDNGGDAKSTEDADDSGSTDFRANTKMIPEISELNWKLFELPQFKCCLIEHNYFKRKITDVDVFKEYVQLNGKTTLGSQSRTTVSFGNKIGFDENRTEQQTIEVKDSITKHVDQVSLLKIRNFNSLRDNCGKTIVNSSNWKVSSREGDRVDDWHNLSSVKFPGDSILRILRSSSDESSSGVDPVSEGRSMIRLPYGNGTDSDGGRCVSPEKRETNTEEEIRGESNEKTSEKSDFGDRIVSLDEIEREITEMEKLIQSECEFLCEERKEKCCKSGNEKNAATGEAVSWKLKKVTSKKDAEESEKEDDYVLPVRNLKKITPEDKNWNVEYTEDDVKNLGLDDLLLRASVLNAENFTKALGQNTLNRNVDKSDASDIVLSFPNSRRSSDDSSSRESGELTKGINTKKTKLKFFKTYVKDGKSGKVVKEETAAKKVVDPPPKRPGIKVKTVQNINEEFKDSLGAKLKMFENPEVASDDPVAAKPLFSAAEDSAKSFMNSKDVFVSEAREQVNNSSLLNCKPGKITKPQSQRKDSVDETRPFIMTIIQNKDNSGKEHVPAAILSGSKLYAPRGKTLKPENVNFLSQIEDHRSDVVGKKDAADSVEVRNTVDNVTLLVSEPRTPRPFEVVNVAEFPPSANGVSSKKNGGIGADYIVRYRNGSFSKMKDGTGDGKSATAENGILPVPRKKNIPFILNSGKKLLQMVPQTCEKTTGTVSDDGGKRILCASRAPNRLVKYPAESNGATLSAVSADDKVSASGEKSAAAAASGFDQKNAGKDQSGKFVKLVSTVRVTGAQREESPKPDDSQVNSSAEDSENDRLSYPRQQIMSLTAFSTILKDILPDKWILSLDKRYGLQIIKTHLDELLNPSIMISIVVGRTGKVTVNVRGRQLENTHALFSNLCDVANSNEKISINYILAILNKLRFFNVCFGCDDLSLKKYWCEDGFIEYYTEFQQTYRSHICELLVRLGKKRCYPCYRMHESLKKRKRREQLLKKNDAETGKVADGSGTKAVSEVDGSNVSNASNASNANASTAPAANQSKGVKRNLEEFLEESFITMKQKIVDEIEKTKEDEENKKVPKTQDEVLSFMGLTRKDTLDVNLRKSKRERKGFKKCESVISNTVNKQELYFLEKYWPDINVLFSTNLLIGAYSRTSVERLREKCRMFHKLLSTWRVIIRDNPNWLGSYINLAENLVEDVDPLNTESANVKFDRMDIPTLRTYIINCVKEVNKIKSRLRSKNTYFKVLYNTFVKPRMKKARQASESSESPEGKSNSATATSKDAAKEESAVEKTEEQQSTKPSNAESATQAYAESSDEKGEDTQCSNGLNNPTHPKSQSTNE